MTEQDRQYLQLLSIFHYVVAGLAALFSMIPGLHLAIGLMMVAESARGGPDEAYGMVVGWLFFGLAAVFILGGLAYAVCMGLAGRYLAGRSHYTFCLVMAAISCLFMPFGTVLGVFTLIVLVRPSVKEAFEGAPPSSIAAPPTD